MMRNEYAALLDLDGTLIDSLHIYYIAVNKLLARYGVSCTYEELFTRSGASGEELYTHFLKKNGKYDPSMKDEMYDMFDGIVYTLLEDVSFPEESYTAICILKSIGYKIAICTGASQRFVKSIVPGDILDIIDSVVTCDDVSFGKPHPETFLMAADNIGIHPSNCVVVGDSSGDLIGAERAGMKFVLVRNMHNTYIRDGYVMEINNIMEFIP